MKYSLIGPAFALPLVWIGRKLFGDAYDLTIIYNQLLFAGTLLVGYALLKKRMDQALLRKFYLLLILLFASIPASFALAVRFSHRKEASLALNLFTLVVFVLSVWVCIDGAVYQWVNGITLPPICAQNHANLEMLCYYTPEFSSLWSPFVFHYPLDIEQILFMSYIVIAALYMAVPLCVQIVRQSVEPLKKYSHMYLAPRLWRF